MPFKFHKIPGFTGLSSRKDARDIGNGLSKAQNISLDVGGKIRTIGGLEDFTKVDNVTALTQTAKIAPGSGLFTYGSDHWRGTDTIVDLLSQLNAASDHDADNDGPNATTGWSITLGTCVSVADTDGASIASNSTSYILKITNGAGSTSLLTQSYSTVIGQRYLLSGDLYNLDLTSIKIDVAGAAGGGAPLYGASFLFDTGSWENKQIGFVAETTTTYVRVFTQGGGAGKIGYADDIYVTAVGRRDLDTNWLALADVATAQVDIYNVISDSFTAGLLDFGTVSSYVATIDTINFPTTKTITDSTSQFLNQGIQAGDVRIISGSALNNIMFVVEHVSAGTITARGNPFVVDADDDGTVTLTKYNPVAFHYVNEALRASPANGGIALRPKHYSFADRIHFEGADSSERKFSNWYANDVGPVAPTDVAFDAAVDSGLSGNLTAGAGWEVGMTETADDGEWAAGTYIIACSFIYDDGQESALYVPAADVAMTAITEGASLTLCAKADTATNYDERISGGRVYCRLDETDDPWTLLMDISMAKGARATLSGTYNAWAEGATTDDVYTASFVSKRQNIDSYESLAGVDPTTPIEVFTGDNAFWNTSVIARNRCFIGAPRYTAEGGALSHFRDRILYSTVGAFDTFPITNYIDVVQGDAEDYVKLGAYGNTLLAFKESTLYLIDISDPDDAGWQMKQDANEGKYPFRGIAHPGAYFETPVGPAWCNKFGVFLYNGSEIVPLLGDKIELSEHPLAYQRYMEFDGSNDYVSKSNDADLNFGAHTDFSIEVIFKTSSAGTMVLVEKGSTTGTDKRYSVYVNTNRKLAFWLDDAANPTGGTSSSAVGDGEWHHGACTFDRDGNGTIYIDGAADGTPVSIAGVTATIDDATKPLAIGISANDLSTSPFTGDIALVHIWNRKLSAAEVLALYNGQPVLAADQWGSQTEHISNGDMDPYTTGLADDWTKGHLASNYSIVSSFGFTTGQMVDANGTARAWFLQESADMTVVPTAGKKYRLTFDYASGSGTGLLTVAQGTSGVGTTISTFPNAATSTAAEVEFTADGIEDRLGFYNPGSSAFLVIDNVSIVEIGCVAEYAPKGIGDATWTDQSGNSLDGTVVRATAIMPDDWASFYTDYSILGYHARTNQIIIMRDCTGKWSSGQDYGDCMAIDIDTLAITTGRRIFTKGIAYSNWATDWAQNLIIAEQTSSTSVTIKRWSEEPQEQAVGLIDIRTADFDFGNPMFAKIIDAFIATYKSSAAQTNPLSYALDGDDRQTAWTRITGNFDAEGFWEKFVAEIATFNCDSIRLKIDNPTAACVMELNDLGLRFEELPLKIS